MDECQPLELGARGLRTAAHVRSVPRATLCAWLGARVGAHIHDAAWGVDRQHVAEKPPPGAVTCEDSFRACSTFAAVVGRCRLTLSNPR